MAGPTPPESDAGSGALSMRQTAVLVAGVKATVPLSRSDALVAGFIVLDADATPPLTSQNDAAPTDRSDDALADWLRNLSRECWNRQDSSQARAAHDFSRVRTLQNPVSPPTSAQLGAFSIAPAPPLLVREGVGSSASLSLAVSNSLAGPIRGGFPSDVSMPGSTGLTGSTGLPVLPDTPSRIASPPASPLTVPSGSSSVPVPSTVLGPLEHPQEIPPPLSPLLFSRPEMPAQITVVLPASAPARFSSLISLAAAEREEAQRQSTQREAAEGEAAQRNSEAEQFSAVLPVAAAIPAVEEAIPPQDDGGLGLSVLGFDATSTEPLAPAQFGPKPIQSPLVPFPRSSASPSVTPSIFTPPADGPSSGVSSMANASVFARPIQHEPTPSLFGSELTVLPTVALDGIDLPRTGVSLPPAQAIPPDPLPGESALPLKPSFMPASPAPTIPAPSALVPPVPDLPLFLAPPATSRPPILPGPKHSGASSSPVGLPSDPAPAVILSPSARQAVAPESEPPPSSGGLPAYPRAELTDGLTAGQERGVAETRPRNGDQPRTPPSTFTTTTASDPATPTVEGQARLGPPGSSTGQARDVVGDALYVGWRAELDQPVSNSFRLSQQTYDAVTAPQQPLIAPFIEAVPMPSWAQPLPAIAPDATVVVEVVGLKKDFRNNSRIVSALDDVSLSISAGEFVVITGPSGSGKTTLLNCLAGFDSADSGQIVVDGYDVALLSDGERTRHRSSAMGFVFQSYNLLGVLTAVENVEVPLLLNGWTPSEARDEARAALTLVGMANRADHLPDDLSGGEQQRVTIARALVGEPKLLWADEPTGNLDPESTEGIMHLLRELNIDGLTIVMVTHDRAIASLAHRCLELRDGKLSEAVVAVRGSGNSGVGLGGAVSATRS
jgi:putative ABC transport system ATP-binding protein